MTPAPKTSSATPAPASPKMGEKKSNPWLIVSIILAIILIAVLALKVFESKPADVDLVVLEPEEASDSLMDFIDTIYGPQIGDATFKKIEKENGLYKATVEIVDPQTGQPVDQNIYITVDGKLFIPQAINISTTLQQFEEYQQAQLQQQAQQQIQVEQNDPTDTEPEIEEPTEE